MRAFTPAQPVRRGYGGAVIPGPVHETVRAQVCSVAVPLTARLWLDGVGSPPGQ